MLREQLGLQDLHFGRGKHRSTIAFRVNARGRQVELELEKVLKEHFGEMFLHTEFFSSVRDKCRLDFFVYSPDGNFGIDIFYPDTFYTFIVNINTKERGYVSSKEKIYLVVGSKSITQEKIDKFISHKRNCLPGNIFIMTLANFLEVIKLKWGYIAVVEENVAV